MNEVAIRVVIEKVKLDAKTTMSYTTTILKLSIFRNLKNSFFLFRNVVWLLFS